MIDYPDIDCPECRSVLPVSLQRGFSRLGEDIAGGVVDRENLWAILDELSDLPLSAVPRADRDIRAKTVLYAYREYDIQAFLNEVLRRTPEDLLRKGQGLEFIFVAHASGYLREAALRTIDGPVPNAFLFCFIAYQINNWVPEVRQAAVNCIKRVMPKTSADIVTQASMYLLGARRAWQRGCGEAVVFDGFLARADVLDLLISRLRTQVASKPHSVLKSILHDPRVDDRLVDLLQARHPAVRGLAADTIIRQRAKWPVGWKKQWIDSTMGQFRRVVDLKDRPMTSGDVEATLAEASEDRSAQVRKIAMQAIVDAPELWPSRKSLIEKPGGDRSVAIRAGIDYILRQQAKQ